MSRRLRPRTPGADEDAPQPDASCPVACDDGIACTRDDCDPSGRCTHLPDDSQCPDTQLCSPKRGCDAFVYGAASDGHVYEVRIPSAELVDVGLAPATAANLALTSDGTLYDHDHDNANDLTSAAETKDSRTAPSGTWRGSERYTRRSCRWLG
jgi:hypothetical protein